MNCCIVIGSTKFNVCFYADKLLICCIIVSRLQTRIVTTNTYITSHGMKFNPSKSMCITFSKSSFRSKNCNIDIEKATIIYLATTTLANSTKAQAQD